VFNARLAQRRITGPRNFLTGIFGYLHLYGKDQFTGSDLFDGLGKTYKMQEVAFKKYPGCAMASGPTDVALSMLRDYDLDPSKIQSVKLFLPPYGFRLVGHEFRIGDNPTVDGQFSAQYCVANVLLRGSSRIRHFTREAVCDPKIGKLVSKISVTPDAQVALRGHTAMDMEIKMSKGEVYRSGIDIAPGFRGNPLTDEDHMQRFMDCVDFAPAWFEKNNAYELIPLLKTVEEMPDVRLLIHQLTTAGHALGTGTLQ
jgi:2-methylcitrate dehydratase PrpD